MMSNLNIIRLFNLLLIGVVIIHCLPQNDSEKPKKGQTKDPIKIAQEKCVQYASAQYIKGEIKPKLVGQSPSTVRTLDCSKTDNITQSTKLAGLNEFPHMALIGYHLDDITSTDYETWHCAGTLISERYVLTAAQCVLVGNLVPKVVRLGELTLFDDKDGASPTDFKIAKIIAHPEFDFNKSIYHDIALLELEKNVTFNPHMRPACLYTGPSISDKKVVFTGWGVPQIGEQLNNHLSKGQLNIDETGSRCNSSYEKAPQLPHGFNSETMICTLFVSGKPPCSGDGGAPIQLPMPEWGCMWSQIGIISYGSVFCGKNPDVSTKISYYIPWIQSIVWP